MIEEIKADLNYFTYRYNSPNPFVKNQIFNYMELLHLAYVLCKEHERVGLLKDGKYTNNQIDGFFDYEANLDDVYSDKKIETKDSNDCLIRLCSNYFIWIIFEDIYCDESNYGDKSNYMMLLDDIKSSPHTEYLKYMIHRWYDKLALDITDYSNIDADIETQIRIRHIDILYNTDAITKKEYTKLKLRY